MVTSKRIKVLEVTIASIKSIMVEVTIMGSITIGIQKETTRRDMVMVLMICQIDTMMTEISNGSKEKEMIIKVLTKKI